MSRWGARAADIVVVRGGLSSFSMGTWPVPEGPGGEGREGGAMLSAAMVAMLGDGVYIGGGVILLILIIVVVLLLLRR